MFGFGVKPPLPDELRLWVDDGFVRLERMLGRERMLKAPVVVPSDTYFPDTYDGSLTSVRQMAVRIAALMDVPRDAFAVDIYAENEDTWRKDLPIAGSETRDAAGLYFHQPDQDRYPVGVHANLLDDPLALAATLAHELAHVLLLGGHLLDREAKDMEPLTDLCTVFLGMGFFTASTAFQFKKWTNDRYEGWSTSRKGYLSEEIWGYALAYFAHERGEKKPEWVRDLPLNIREYFKRSARWLEAQ